MTIRLSGAFAPTVGRVLAALKEQGFGLLTEIDVRATLLGGRCKSTLRSGVVAASMIAGLR
jgi:uncharacterized protein (DUF302 family)